MRNKLMEKTQVQEMPTKNDFIRALRSQDPAFLTRMQELARQRGISEEDIAAGMKLLRGLKI